MLPQAGTLIVRSDKKYNNGNAAICQYPFCAHTHFFHVSVTTRSPSARPKIEKARLTPRLRSTLIAAQVADVERRVTSAQGTMASWTFLRGFSMRAFAMASIRSAISRTS